MVKPSVAPISKVETPFSGIRPQTGTASRSGEDETWAAARYQGPTSKVARYCVLGRVGEKEADYKEGPLGLEPSCDGYNPLTLGANPGSHGSTGSSRTGCSD